MVDPSYYNVEYSINPFMQMNEKVDHEKAYAQWEMIKNAYLAQGLEVEILTGVEGLPDMVFCANPFFSHPNGILISQMRFEQRAKESEFFANYFKEKVIFQAKESFEGNGDLLWNYETMELFGGFGFRTKETIYPLIEKALGQSIVQLELISEDYYHLDTCLCILNAHTAAIVESAFSAESLAILKSKFSDIIYLDEREAKTSLAGNALSIDGRCVFVEKNALEFQKQLSARDFKVCVFDTSEYLKSGGSIFCMKNLIF